jgi:hypothetical protein
MNIVSLPTADHQGPGPLRCQRGLPTAEEPSPTIRVPLAAEVPLPTLGCHCRTSECCCWQPGCCHQPYKCCCRLSWGSHQPSGYNRPTSRCRRRPSRCRCRPSMCHRRSPRCSCRLPKKLLLREVLIVVAIDQQGSSRLAPRWASTIVV